MNRYQKKRAKARLKRKRSKFKSAAAFDAYNAQETANKLSGIVGDPEPEKGNKNRL